MLSTDTSRALTLEWPPRFVTGLDVDSCHLLLSEFGSISLPICNYLHLSAQKNYDV